MDNNTTFLASNSCCPTSPILDFINILVNIRRFNSKNTRFKRFGFGIIFTLLFLSNFRSYFQVLALRFRGKKIKNIKDFKDISIDPCRFHKFQSIQPIITFLFDIDNTKLQKDDPRIGVFTRNLEDRGVDSLGNNLKKREYMSAFDLKTIPYYDTHINDLLNSLHDDSIKNIPLLSSFSNNLVTYFLNIHLGIPKNNHMKRPKYVFDYFQDIFKVFALKPKSSYWHTSVFDIDFANVIFGVSIKERAPKVKEYFKKRIEEIKKERPMDKSIAVTNWLTSGFDVQSVETAAFHNIVAFSQFIQILFLICNNHIKNPNDNKTYINRYKKAKSQKEINILIFDMFKYEVPNSGSISRDIERNEYVKHNHRETMRNVDPSNQLYKKNIKNFGDYSSKSKCPFHNSSIDNETVIPCGADKLIPVFDKPLYTPFGLGYRRCAGELLTYRFTDYILNFLTNYKIKQNLNITDEIAIGPGNRKKDNFFIKKC